MRRENKNPRKILFSVLIAIAFVVLAGIKLGYANIISPKQGINEYHFYNDTIENKDSAKEIQKQIVLDKKSISDPGHVFKDKDKVLLKWQDEEGNDIKFDTPIEIKGNDKKIINVYPVFKNQVVITYYISGSTNDRVYMTDTITDASSYKLPVDPTIYDANKYFVNWSETKDGKSGVYDEESLKKDIAAGKTDIKLYAITEFKHKATFITGDGASFQDQILADDGGKLDKMPEKPTRAGYEFSHWSLTEDGDPVDLNTLVLDKDINVYAVWKPVVVDYKFKVMVQNINDDGYTFHEIISARGLNGEKTSLPFKGSENPDPKVAPSGPIVEDIAKLTEKDGRFNDSYNSKDENGQMDHTYTNPQTLDYLGFHLNEEKTKQAFETIKADGSTVVPVYMDRNVHTIWVYKNASGTSYYQANWVNATDENGNIHVDLRYGQSSETWFDKLNKDYIYYKDKSIGSFYTKAPVMGDKDVYMYRVYAKGQGFQLRFVEWDPSKFNAQINSGSLDQLKATLGTMKEIGDRVKFENTEHYVTYYGRNYRVFEPSDGMWASKTNTWVDETDHVDDIKGFQPKTGDMSADGLQSVNVNNPAFRDYMFTPKGYGGYFNYTGTKYIDNGSYVGFLFYKRKTYNIIYYSGNKKLASNPYKYEADTSDFGLDYKIGETKNPDNPNQVFMGWYEDSSFSVEHKHEDGAKMPAHDITVYAKWDSRQYEVTFHTNQDDYEKDIEKITEIPEDDTLYDGKYKDAKVSEENFPQPVKPKDATEFLGWYEKNKNGRFVKANLHKPIKNNDTHLYAKWKYYYLELKYDLNLPATDKVEGKAPTDSNSYIKDAKAQATDVGNVKVNGGKKVFVGWSETKDGSSGLILPSETVLMDKSKTLYAQWKEIPDLPTTKVTYDANGGVGDQYVVEEIITNDSHKVLGNGEGEKINYTREGYVFKGWNRDKNATKAEFQKDDEVTVNSLDESKNNYIYAIWAPIINYTTDGNGQVKEDENFVDNTKEEVELKSNPKGTETKAKEGYKFSHWTADKEITLNDGTKIPVGEKITEEQLKQAVITEPLTFTANFVKDAPNEFNVTHEFKVAKDSPIKEMPADIKIAVYSQLPDDKKAEDGKTTTPGELKNPENVEDKTNDGVWKFEGFKDQNPDTKDVDAKVNGADVTFEGTWKFTPNKHKVTYEYVSGTEGKELPEALKAKAPKEVTGKVKGNTVTSPVPTGDDATFRDDKNKGTWTFKSYDKNEVEITNKDENVKGTWEFTPDPEPGKYNVTHKFVSKDPNKELPKEVLALVPADQTGKVKGDVVKPTEPQTKTVNVEDGTWTFVEYDKNQETIDNKDVEFTGTWEFTPKTTPTDYNVNHKFVSSTEGKALPKAVTDLTPDQQTGKKDGETVTPTAPKETTVEDAGNDGTWKFEGYDKDSKTIDKSDVTFEGKWKFTPNKHKVTYEYVSGTKGKELPEALKAKAPKEATGKVKGDKVTSPVPEGKDAEFRDETNKGTWTFKSYDKNEVEITNKDENVKGTWVFTPDAEPNKYNVKHEFVSATEGKTLPQAVKELTPKDQTGKEDGSVVKPTEPEKTKVADTENDGTWTFEGYKDQDKTTDEVDAKVNGADVKFEGEWKFTPNEHQVTYKFESEDPTKPLPKEVTDLLPDPEKGKVKGDKVTPTKPIPESITTKDGVWTFVKYDKDSETVDNKDLVFTGTWKFSPKPVPTTYKVNHQFKSATKGKDLPQAVKDQLPDQQTGIEDKSTVTPTAPKKEKVEDTDNDGIWKFKGYKDLDENTEKVDAKVDGADVMFEGSWEFTPNKHKVTYEYVSGTEGKELPAELKAKAPKEVTGKVKGDKVTSPVPEGKDAEFRDDKNKGTWTFKSFDKNSVEISNQDEKVTGTWVFTPDPEYKVEHKFVSSTKGKDLPKAVTNLTPKDQTGKKDGETVTPTAPKETKVEDKTNDGTWTFEGYDKDSKTIDKSDVTFEGKWKFTPNKHEVIHKFVSKDPNKKLPKEVTDLLPANQTGKVKGDEVTPTEPKTKTVKVKDGTWKFVSYDKENKKVEDKDVEFTGTWEFIPDVVTEYVDENGKTIAPKEDGTKPNKEIDGYKFVKTEKDDKGNTKHIYKKKVTPPADVVTEYVDEDGNTIAPKENGKQTNKDIDGYEFVKTTTDDKGNTKHIYKKKTTPSPSIVTKFVDEKGNPLAKDEDGKQDKKDFPGYEFVETKNDKDGNVVHVYKLIPTTTVETRYVDTEGKQILADKAGTHDPSTIEGYQFVKTEKDEKGNTVHIYKKLAPVPKVETRYVDENGNQLLPPKEGTQNQVNIDGYDYISTNKDNNGNTIHVYKKKPIQDVETRYVDTEGNQILADKAGTHDPSNIEGYQFVRTEKDEKGNTRHIYQKLAPVPKVETRYVDENGNQLLLPKEGTQNQVNIDGYDYVSTNKDNNGNTIHVYKKKVITPDVVTKYVDENGNEIADTQKGKHPSKNIEGYEIITTKSDEKGNIIYVYRKKPDPTKVVTKFVDEKGNPIAKSEDGKKPKKDIKGYEFVKTETDKDGNTIHIYKKKENTSKVVTKFVDEKGNPIAESEDGKKPKKDIKGYEFVKTETDKNGNTIHIYKKKSSSAENKYKVTHKFESSTPGKSLPKEILDLLPKNQDGIENGRKVSPTKPSKLEVKVKDGTWVFEGYDKDSSIVNNKDVNFTGKWKFVPNKIGKIKVSTGTNSRSKSNVKTGIEGSSNLIFVLIGSAFALYKNKKNKY
ncbi:SHIRT domain-containing protein [Anaerococcus vaginalis]|uniref:SHIRT domain-containing protein n=3 Tax=Anaerococcus TaxID=165779 RepID=UPI002908314A|nr:SHIRT domain-containing protein [Anaerococcus vaginalis]MDU5461251.1 SHIRT domain-containing protein [Anaerococcus vaginalis]